MASEEAQEKQPNTYVVDPESPVEMARLIDLHRVTTQAMGGPLSGVQSLPEGGKVLDLACGPGGWVLDVAFERPDLEVAGVDVSKTMIEYAIARARTQRLTNASFGVMNILQPLDFSDNTFDLVNARFLVAVLRRDAWQPFLAECTRILKPNGILRLTEPVDVAGITTGKAYETMCQHTYQALWRAGYSFSPTGTTLGLTTVLPHMLRQIAYRNVHCLAHVLEFSSECEAWQDLYQNAQAGNSMAPLFLEQTGVATREEGERLGEQSLIEMLSNDFCGMWHLVTVLGEKP